MCEVSRLFFGSVPFESAWLYHDVGISLVVYFYFPTQSANTFVLDKQAEIPLVWFVE